MHVLTTMSITLLLFTGVLGCSESRKTQDPSQVPSATPLLDTTGPTTAVELEQDSRLWLEDVEGEDALNWVREQNFRTTTRLQNDDRYAPLMAAAQSLYESDDRIPYGDFYGGFVWNFWQDNTHTHGLWRRTTLTSYLTETPQWEVIIDLDALAEKEAINWVWRGADCLAPQYDRCLVTLSKGGSDAAVRREFSLSQRQFVQNGFETPEAKGGIAWIDKDTVLVALATDTANTTDSGYPSVIYRWSRGTELTTAEVVLQGTRQDVGLWPMRFEDRDGSVHMLAAQSHTFYESTYWHLPFSGEAKILPIPAKTSIETLYRGELIFKLAEDWQRADASQIHPAGALVSINLARFIATGEIAAVNTLYVPSPTESIGSVAATKSRLIATLDNNVIGGILTFRFNNDQWSSKTLPVPDNLTISLSSANRWEDIAFVNAEGFLTPDTLFLANTAEATMQPIKTIPERFDTSGLTVEQIKTQSPDGTVIPYFVVRHKNAPLNGTTPTLLYAYGGFQVSMRPRYSGSLGKLWLENGGAYVLANIRGGGEFGPAWHQAGLKTQRQRIYDDLIAVAEDLSVQGLASSEHLAVYGGSNGGLLTGVMYTQRPDLWRAVISAVPLLDMLRYDKLLAGASWVGEYGDPEDPLEGAFLRSISPYHNVSATQEYPEIYLYTSTKDDRVHPGHARKMSHLLSDLGHDYLYFENIDGGHAAAANLSEYARRDAMLYVFLMQKLMPQQSQD